MCNASRRNTGTAFAFTRSATVQPTAGWKLAPGNLGGDARDDVVGYHPSSASVWVGENVGQSFTLHRVNTLSPAGNRDVVAAPGRTFTGPERSEVVAYQPGTGILRLGRPG